MPTPHSTVPGPSRLTCPSCGHVKTEIMPIDACQWLYECEACHSLLRPLPGDCCVFCSYGDVPCPPVQAARGATCAGGGCPADALD